MDIVFTIETTNGKVWKATCSDPSLEVEGPDAISVSRSMTGMIESWFITTFNTTKKVIVEVPIIKAKVKASVSIRSETPLDKFEPDVKVESRPITKVEKKVDGPCMYISDGKGVLPVGQCEAQSMEPSDTPGIQTDAEGCCSGNYESCAYYKSGGSHMVKFEEPEPDPDESLIEDDDEDYPSDEDDEV